MLVPVTLSSLLCVAQFAGAASNVEESSCAGQCERADGSDGSSADADAQSALGCPDDIFAIEQQYAALVWLMHNSMFQQSSVLCEWQVRYKELAEKALLVRLWKVYVPTTEFIKMHDEDVSQYVRTIRERDYVWTTAYRNTEVREQYFAFVRDFMDGFSKICASLQRHYPSESGSPVFAFAKPDVADFARCHSSDFAELTGSLLSYFEERIEAFAALRELHSGNPREQNDLLARIGFIGTGSKSLLGCFRACSDAFLAIHDSIYDLYIARDKIIADYADKCCEKYENRSQYECKIDVAAKIALLGDVLSEYYEKADKALDQAASLCTVLTVAAPTWRKKLPRKSNKTAEETLSAAVLPLEMSASEKAVQRETTMAKSYFQDVVQMIYHHSQHLLKSTDDWEAMYLGLADAGCGVFTGSEHADRLGEPAGFHSNLEMFFERDYIGTGIQQRHYKPFCNGTLVMFSELCRHVLRAFGLDCKVFLAENGAAPNPSKFPLAHFPRAALEHVEKCMGELEEKVGARELLLSDGSVFRLDSVGLDKSAENNNLLAIIDAYLKALKSFHDCFETLQSGREAIKAEYEESCAKFARDCPGKPLDVHARIKIVTGIVTKFFHGPRDAIRRACRLSDDMMERNSFSRDQIARTLPLHAE